VDGTDALRLLAENVYAAIVSDLAMPKLDGRGLYQEVERRYPTAQSRLVFVTGYAEAEEYDEFLRQSGVPVLAKPFTIADLLGAVKRAFSPA
jgi:CheY-like chemotaxis protein